MGCAGSKTPFGVVVSYRNKAEEEKRLDKPADQQSTAAPTPEVPIYIPELQQGWGAYQGAPLLSSDAARVDELRGLNQVHPTLAEARFDHITKVVAELFDMPVAAITLIDNLSCYVKSHNPGMDFRGDQPTDRRLAFGSWTQVPLNPEVLVLEDATLDARSRESPWVLGRPHIRFYAGAPLVATNGARIGTLHVADFKRRKFGASAATILCNLAEMAARELSAGPVSASQPMARVQQQTARIMGSNHRLHPIVPCGAAGVVLVDVSRPRWPILFCDSLWTHHTGMGEDALIGKAFWDAYAIPGVSSKEAAPWDAFARAIQAREMFCVGVVDVMRAADLQCRFGITFKPASRDNVDAVTRQIRISHHKMGATEAHEDERLDRCPFEDVSLGPLLGRGSFGCVFVGNWNGAPCAVKVIEHKLSDQGIKEADAMLEGMLGLKLSHPNVVRTFKYMVTPRAIPKRNPRRSPDPGRRSGRICTQQGPSYFHPCHIAPNFAQPAACSLCGTIPVWKRKRSPDLWAAKAAEVARSQLLADNPSPSTSQGDSSPSMTTARLWEESSHDLGAGSTQAAVACQGTGALTRSQWCIETWLVMELCGLGDLQEHIDQGVFRDQLSSSSYAGGVKMLWIVMTAAEIAAAMAYLHSQDILHGDLSGGNVLLVGNSGADDRPFAAKVADFGLSRILAGDDTVETVSFGTVTHMPPELLREGRLSKAADVYAYGVLLWSMYTGQRPWAGMRHVQIIAQKIIGNASLPFPDHTPRAYRELAESCMDPDDSARPCFDDVVAALKPVRAAVRYGKPTHADFAVYPAYADTGRPALIVKQEDAAQASTEEADAASKISNLKAVFEE
ncbi:hypothetical protein WJX72_012343 [[Myrmecia] bisecta]|uniref:Protein kinase domain-containing protein n=1 Tax=[Myrmecia] bisecta TaxID=41462 RepID=A0AAW1PIK7_9CHLO